MWCDLVIGSPGTHLSKAMEIQLCGGCRGKLFVLLDKAVHSSTKKVIDK